MYSDNRGVCTLGGVVVNIAALGANGRTGRQVITHALARGHTVTAIVRRTDSMNEKPNVIVRVADVHDASAVRDALIGCDAVISALGAGTSRSPTTVFSEGISNVLDGMRQHEIRKLSVISAAPVSDRSDAPYVERALVMPILDRFFGASYADLRVMEQILQATDGLDWVCLRPPRLTDKEATGTYRISAMHRLARAGSITRGDLAIALLDSLADPHLYAHTAYVAN